MKNFQEEYNARRERLLIPLASKLENYLRERLSNTRRIDRVTVRAKEVGRFVEKAMKVENGKRKYKDPLNEIQDQIGARIITYYRADVEPVSKIVRKYFGFVESKTLAPESETEFGYEGVHFINFIPDELFDTEEDGKVLPFFELQIKTLFQHAWSEASHDLGYKPEVPLSADQRRRLAFTAAQAWGADRLFEEMFRETHESMQ